MHITQKYLDDLTFWSLLCYRSSQTTGAWLVGSVYEKCFARELTLNDIEFKTQICLPVEYKGVRLEAELQLDILVEDQVLVEIKAIGTVLPVHYAQVVSNMRLMKKAKGI